MFRPVLTIAVLVIAGSFLTIQISRFITFTDAHGNPFDFAGVNMRCQKCQKGQAQWTGRGYNYHCPECGAHYWSRFQIEDGHRVALLVD